MVEVELLVFGYIRVIEQNWQLTIPTAIQLTITSYLMKYLVFAIGKNDGGLFGLGHQVPVHNWTKLHYLGDLISSLNDVYFSGNAMVITSNNELYVAGGNRDGKLGLNPFKNSFISSFTKLSLNNMKLKFVSSKNYTNSFIVTKDNKLYANGINKYGNFGNSHTNDCTQILQYIKTDFLMNNELIIDIKCRGNRSVFLTNIGNIYCCGCNDKGQCGFLEPNKITKPLLIRIPDNQKIIKFEIGKLHTILINKKHEIMYFGNNTYGQCGNNNNNTVIYTPMLHTYFKDGNIKIIHIQCQLYTSFFIDIDNNLYCCGFNRFGNLGIGHVKVRKKRKNIVHKVHFIAKDSKIVDASCGSMHIAVLSKNNNLICWGNNTNNECSILNDDFKISMPHVVSKIDELNIAETDIIDKVLTSSNSTIIFVNPMHKIM